MKFRSDVIDNFLVVSADDARPLPRRRSPRLRLSVPAHWRSPVQISPHAAAANEQILAWFGELGCSSKEIEHARCFDIGGYVGIPFPQLDLDATVRIGKYLALWLLWDDVDVEALSEGWRIGAAEVLEGRRPAQLSRFDEGWWQLMREFSATRSPEWVERLCTIMQRWSDAAQAEAALKFRYQETGELPSFATQLELRIATIGMYGAACLLEELHDQEAPRAFHQHPIISMLQYLGNKIVGLGNDLFSFGKDYAEGQINLVSTLMRERGLELEDALAELVSMHDQALLQYDRLATQIAPWATKLHPAGERWIHDLRICSLGFSVWESQAPRYTAYQLVSEGEVLVPRFDFTKPAMTLAPTPHPGLRPGL